METMITTRYEYDYTVIYLVRAYDHSEYQVQDPFGNKIDMIFADLEAAKQFVLDYRSKKGVWQMSPQGWFCASDPTHGWQIIELQLVSAVRELKKVAVS